MGTLNTLGLNASFSLATNAMGAQRAAIEITGHNIANANTAGYARQRINLTTATPVQTAIGQQGTGVVVQGIEQLRDAYMDTQVPQNLSGLNYNQELSTLLNQVQTNLQEPLDRTNSVAATFPTQPGTGLNTAIEQFFASWKNLSSDPSNMVMRREVVINAQNVTAKLNTVATNLENTQIAIHGAAVNTVDEINNLCSEVARLNATISAVEVGHMGSANDLKDQRQRVIEQLSQKIDIHTQEDSQGMIEVRIGNETGPLLVSGTFSGNTALKDTIKLGIKNTGSTFASTVIGFWNGGESETPGNLDPLSQQPASGTLLAQVQVVNNTIGDDTTGLISNYNRIAEALSSMVNTLHATGFTLEGSPAYATAGTDHFFDNDSISGNVTGTITAKNIKVNADILTDPAKVAASDTAGQPNNGDLATFIATIREAVNGDTINGQVMANNLGGITISNYYLNAVSDVGSDINNADAQITTHKLFDQQLQKQRDSTMGVSMDEETANLLKFQHAFEAAAMLVSTVNDMMKAVIASVR